MNYKESQYQHQVDVLEAHPELFNMDKGNGYYKKKKYPFILENGINNLFEPLGENRKNREKICQYFKDNNISWWGGLKLTGHMLSSQIACLNHLFYIRDDENAVLKLINNIHPGLQFTRVLPLPIDKNKSILLLRLLVSMTT